MELKRKQPAEPSSSTPAVVAGTGKQHTSSWQGRVAVVTGASSGIGAALVRRLGKEGLRVLATGRRIDRLETLAAEVNRGGGEVFPLAIDLEQQGAPEQLFETTSNRYGRVDVLVNNAGLGWYGYFTEMPWEVTVEMLRVNLAAVVHLTHLFLPGMKSRRCGRVINIGSIAGCIPSQGVVIYSSTKAFLDAFTTSLHRELAHTGVTASVVRAGPVRTEFCNRAAALESGLRLPTERIGVSADRVARVACSLLHRPRRVVYVPVILALTPWLENIFGWLMDQAGPLLLKRQSKNPL